MKKSLRLSSLYVAVVTASLVTSAAALAGNYKGEHHHNLKGERVEAPCPPPAKVLRDGFYVGAQAGYDSYRVRQSTSFNVLDTAAFAIPGIVDVGNPIAFGESENPVLNATGFGGGLFLGYGQYIQDFYYLGGEIWANGTNASTSYRRTRTDAVITAAGPIEDARSTSRSVKGEWSWGVSILPGIKVNESTLAYARLGYARHQLKTSVGFSEFATPDAVFPLGVADAFSASNKSWYSGFAYGLGMETVICQNWSVRGDYTHTNLGSNNLLATNFSASDNQYMLSLIYHFDLNNMFA